MLLNHNCSDFLGLMRMGQGGFGTPTPQSGRRRVGQEEFRTPAPQSGRRRVGQEEFRTPTPQSGQRRVGQEEFRTPTPQSGRRRDNIGDATSRPAPPSPAVNSRFQSQWQKGKSIGGGTFGDVYRGHNSEDGTFCVIKEVRHVQDSEEQLNQEINMLTEYSHPNIVKYYGKSKTDGRLSIFLEYVPGGSINDILREVGPLKEPVIRKYTRQILSGLNYLHENRIIHRDIKGANALICPNGEVKLADFGMAKRIRSFAQIHSTQGTVHWMAPEVIKSRSSGESYSLSADIWSVGCTVIEMATAKPPWGKDLEPMAAMYRIASTNEIPEFPEMLSDDGKHFLWLCLNRDPASRPSAAWLLEHHPFVKEGPAV